MDTTANPNLKFHRLSDAEVVEKMNNLAIDAQWDFTNAKSPKGQREAEERLNLYGSACEMLRSKTAPINININKLVDKIDITSSNYGEIKEQITNALKAVIDDANTASE